MISTQKIVVLILMIQILIGIAMELNAKGIDGTPLAKTNDTITISDAEVENFKSDEGIWGSIKNEANQLYESTIGNVMEWGATALNVLLKGLNPFSINSSQYDTNIEKLIATIILVIRSFMTTIVIFEGYSYFKNKKAT